MEDWEAFFAEKSRRRAHKVRRSTGHQKWIGWVVTVWLIGIVGVVVALA